MGKSESKDEKPEKERRFSQEQYDMLKRCSDRKDTREWNEWREKNPDEEIWLQGVNFEGWYLQRANFMHANQRCKKTNASTSFGEVHLEKAVFEWADLQKSVFAGAKMDGAKLWSANAKDAEFVGTHLESADLSVAHFDNCNFSGAFLKNAKIVSSHINGANFAQGDLQGCSARAVIVDGKTNLAYCRVNRYSTKQLFTDFNIVDLSNVRIDPGTKQLLEYNIRRMNWEEWYKEHWFWRRPVQAFWAMSDYGMSTLRVMGVFFILALLFAAVYMNWAYWSPPGIVSNLMVQPEVGEAALHYFGRAVIRPIYFSVVTMTTLWFGDMYANKGSIAGHVLLILQVILGYVLLGALVTRFAVLFTAGGPAGKFAKEKK